MEFTHRLHAQRLWPVKNHPGYRRAAARWMEVMLLCTEDDDREWIKRRRETCLENVKRPPVKVEEFGDLHKAVTETQHRMGIAQPNGNAFRLNGGKRQR
ncbi:TPA: PerC family transcriptional regulator [Escherichia coli]|uniref:PerC family transcriptional regulator n=1 Tax=Escherichia coli TaxID=562 RepID=UPI0023B04DC7|nr:PerC family transcriptional regulator [Escherichia coli]EJZ0893144.1 PerC family transcriptional regulator [Escherichia coli]EJZ9717428.1 PerC family transcriptional regulator [Escherichia coli]EKA2521513.1 PerC family transcriptional regulator [Escherichia coli]ELO1001420.1 PerC family transcriptional regulator [Escherichia coli]HBH9512531.1 PerC family transcriptional regulator [Escherichia coli]